MWGANNPAAFVVSMPHTTTAVADDLDQAPAISCAVIFPGIRIVTAVEPHSSTGGS